MRVSRVRLGALCLAASLALLPWFAGRASALPEGMEVCLTESVCFYDGSPQRPGAEVTQAGETLSGEEYTVTYRDNVEAGTGKAVVSSVHGDWSVEKTFTILPRQLTGEEITFTGRWEKPYDGTTDARGELAAAVVEGDRVTVTGTGTYRDPYVGTDKEVTVSDLTLTGSDAGNYTLAEDLILSAPVGIITGSEPPLPEALTVPLGGTLSLMPLVGDAAHPAFQLEGDNWYGCSVTATKGVFQAGQEPGQVTVLIHWEDTDLNGDGQPEYAAGKKALTVTILPGEDPDDDTPETDITDPDITDPGELADQEDLILRGETRVTYGQTIQFSVTGGSGSGRVTYYLLDDMSGKGILEDSGLFTATGVGKVRVAAVKAGDQVYRPRTANALEVTILPAVLTVTAADGTAQVGDPVPDLTSWPWTVTGLVGEDALVGQPTLSYGSEPDMTRPGTVSVVPAGGAVPNENYDPEIRWVPGTLTILDAPEIRVEETVGGVITADRTSAPEGTLVTLTVTAGEGQALESLTVTGEDGALCPLTAGEEGIFTFLMPNGPVTVTGTFAPAETALPFTDVTEGDWFYESVAYVYREGLMKGTSDTIFSPGGTTTRGMIVTILHRMEGAPAPDGLAPFGDVPPGVYYAQAVSWAAGKGIVNGLSYTTFAPNDPITREQLAAILYRFALYRGMDVSQRGDLSLFADRDAIRPYAVDAMAWANGTGLINGVGNGLLSPGGPATRAQVAAILQRFCQGVQT